MASKIGSHEEADFRKALQKRSLGEKSRILTRYIDTEKVQIEQTPTPTPKHSMLQVHSATRTILCRRQHWTRNEGSSTPRHFSRLSALYCTVQRLLSPIARRMRRRPRRYEKSTERVHIPTRRFGSLEGSPRCTHHVSALRRLNTGAQVQ